MSGFTRPGSAEDKIGNQPPSAAATGGENIYHIPQITSVVITAVSRGTNSNQRHLETD